MKILIADDDPVFRRRLTAALTKWGHTVEETCNGVAAWNLLQHPDAPRIAIVDWTMPEMDGLELCKKVRSQSNTGYVYIILLTARGQREDIVKGLEAGADDYVTKPFDTATLGARLQTGKRIVALETALAQTIHKQQAALAQVKQLQGLLPICMHCKKIRDDRDTWHKLETYIEENSYALFSHSLCEACLEEHYPEEDKRER